MTETGLRILFVNHTGSGSGAENAMLRLLDSLPAGDVRAVACPLRGPLSGTVRERGYRQFDLPGTDVSLALHPLRTPLGLLSLLRSAVTLRRITRRFEAEVVHANSVRAGLIAIAACAAGGPPVVVQCHDHLPRSRLGRAVREVVARGAQAVVAVTDRTAAEFNHGLRRPKAERVYISVDHQRFSPAARGVSQIRSELGLSGSARLLLHAAQITPWKGQDTAIRALAQVRRRFDAHLLIAGDVAFASRRYDNAGFHESLKRLARELGVEPATHFLGQRSDVAELMGAADLLLLPSWDEPFGLVVAEAMAVGTPVLATSQGGVGEYLVEGVNGRLLPPGDPEAWAAATLALLGDDTVLARMRAESVETAARFNDESYSQNMLAVYSRVAGKPVTARSVTRPTSSANRS